MLLLSHCLSDKSQDRLKLELSKQFGLRGEEQQCSTNPHRQEEHAGKTESHIKTHCCTLNPRTSRSAWIIKDLLELCRFFHCSNSSRFLSIFCSEVLAELQQLSRFCSEQLPESILPSDLSSGFHWPLRDGEQLRGDATNYQLHDDTSHSLMWVSIISTSMLLSVSGRLKVKLTRKQPRLYLWLKMSQTFV